MKKIILPEIYSEIDLQTLQGRFIDDEFVHHIINESCDIFSESGDFILSFRKDIISEHLRNIGFHNFKNTIKGTRGRGAAAGTIDKSSPYWKNRILTDTNGFKTGYLKSDGTPSKMKINTPVFSSPLGYYEKQKQMGYDLPCRLTSYSKLHFKEYQEGIPYIQEIADYYKKICPEHYKVQYDRAVKNQFHIEDTPFSTITVNRNFRTGLHKDAGDFGGIACLSVLEEGKYNGGLFCLPRFGIGVNMRHGDLLIADVHQFHCNTEIWTTASQDDYNKIHCKSFEKVNKKIGVAGSEFDFTRMSFVCYLREKLIQC